MRSAEQLSGGSEILDNSEFPVSSFSTKNGISVDAFDSESFFAENDDDMANVAEDAGRDETDNVTQFSVLDMKNGLQVTSQKTAQLFSDRVSVKSLDKGLSVVGNLVSVFGQLAASCGPLCLHALSGAGSAMSSAASASSGLSGLASAAGGLKFDGNGNVSFSGSVDSLAQKTGFSADAIRSGKVSVSDLIAALSLSFGQGMGTVFGFGLIDAFINIIPEGKAA